MSAAPPAPTLPRGRTTIAAPVVAKLASIATREVEGVVSLGGTFAGALSDVVARVRGDEHRTAGVEVVLDERRAAVDLAVALRYPLPLPEVTEHIRASVIDRVQAVAGLEVMEVNIEITELVLAEEPGDIERPRVA